MIKSQRGISRGVKTGLGKHKEGASDFQDGRTDRAFQVHSEVSAVPGFFYISSALLEVGVLAD